MNISISSASHRTNSQSKKVSGFINKNLLNIEPDLDIFTLDLADSSLPLWSSYKKNGEGIWGDTWSSISNNFKKHK